MENAARLLTHDPVLHCIDALGTVASLDDVHANCRDVAGARGFAHYLFAASLPTIDEIVVIDGYPPVWRARYEHRNYWYQDPIVRYASANTAVLDWRQLRPGSGQRGAASRAIMREAREHGLVFGLTLPTHGAGAEWGLLCLATHVAEPVDASLPGDDLHFYAQAMHEAVKRIALSHSHDNSGTKPLTERESECLKWVANGKTAWETARILGLSESTITFHLQNAMGKLGVTNRPQAVARALALSRIALF